MFIDGAISNILTAARPNAGFVQQLEIFHQAAFEISHRDKSTRMFYLERTVGEVMSENECYFIHCMTALLDCRPDGDGSLPDTDMFAKFPSESQPVTPITPRRRIRCKMCRFVFTAVFMI